MITLIFSITISLIISDYFDIFDYSDDFDIFNIFFDYFDYIPRNWFLDRPDGQWLGLCGSSRPYKYHIIVRGWGFISRRCRHQRSKRISQQGSRLSPTQHRRRSGISLTCFQRWRARSYPLCLPSHRSPILQESRTIAFGGRGCSLFLIHMICVALFWRTEPSQDDFDRHYIWSCSNGKVRSFIINNCKDVGQQIHFTWNVLAIICCCAAALKSSFFGVRSSLHILTSTFECLL